MYVTQRCGAQNSATKINNNSYYASCTVHLRARKASNTHAKHLHIICINAFKSALLTLAFAFFLFDLYS